MSLPPSGGAGLGGMAAAGGSTVVAGAVGAGLPVAKAADGGFGLEEIGIPGRDYLR